MVWLYTVPWICKSLTWTECMNVRINEWESPINRFNYVSSSETFSWKRQSACQQSPAPPKEVQCEVQSPAEPWLWNCCGTYQETGAVRGYSWGLQVAMFLFFSWAAQVRDWVLLSSSTLPAMPDCLPDIPDHWSHLVWTSLILDLDINSFHHKYSLSAYHETPLKCKWLLPSSQLSVVTPRSDSVAAPWSGYILPAPRYTLLTRDSTASMVKEDATNRQCLGHCWGPLCWVSVAFPSALGPAPGQLKIFSSNFIGPHPCEQILSLESHESEIPAGLLYSLMVAIDTWMTRERKKRKLLWFSPKPY